MKPYLIAPLTGHYGITLPMHPLPAFLNTLPEIPGLHRTSWNGFTAKQADEILHAWNCNEPLPDKGKTLTIQWPTNPGDTESLALVRVHKSPARSADGKEWLYSFESFKRTLTNNS